MTVAAQPATPDVPIGNDPRPVVRLGRQGVPGAVIAFGAVMLALILFVVLNGQRQQRVSTAQADQQAGDFAPPPPLAMPTLVEPVVAPPAIIVTTPVPPLPSTRIDPPPAAYTPAPFIVPIPPTPFVPDQVPVETAPARFKKAGSAIVFDLGAETAATTGAAGTTSTPATAGTGGGAGSNDAQVRATAMASRTDVVPIGTQIAIALETPIDTARPGLVRAIASRDTHGFDGRRVLIPRGSRFIGEYQADVRSGQNRVLVTWTRVIRPDGVTIRLGSPAADQLGGSGVPGQVHSFFLQRFAGAVLQSALAVGVNLASRPRAGSVVVGIPSGPITTVGQGLLPNDYRPKITVKQGASINVFVARDLDFSGLAAGQP